MRLCVDSGHSAFDEVNQAAAKRLLRVDDEVRWFSCALRHCYLLGGRRSFRNDSAPSHGWSAARVRLPCCAVAAIFNLNHPAHVVHWQFFQMSVANIVVIVLMVVVFVAALLAPFPGRGRP